MSDEYGWPATPRVAGQSAFVPTAIAAFAMSLVTLQKISSDALFSSWWSAMGPQRAFELAREASVSEYNETLAGSITANLAKLAKNRNEKDVS